MPAACYTLGLPVQKYAASKKKSMKTVKKTKTRAQGDFLRVPTNMHTENTPHMNIYQPRLTRLAGRIFPRGGMRMKQRVSQKIP